MPRSVKEWIGRTPDTAPPPRVRLRVLDRFDRRCAECRRPIRPGDRWTCDHGKALINGGANRESNLRLLCEWCDPVKTAADVAEKSRVYRKRLRHAGIKLKAIGRPLPGTVASGIKLHMHGRAPIDRATGLPWRGRT